MTLAHRARHAVLKRHKRRQTNGLWCEPGCVFHKTITAEQVWKTHIGGWTFLYVDTVDRLAKEGLWD